MATGYHNFDEYVQGEDNWDYNTEFRSIDRLLWKVGESSNKPSSPPDESLYLSIDTNEILQYDGSNDLWNTILGGGGGGGGGGDISVKDDDTTIEDTTNVIDFSGDDFNVTNPTSGRVNVLFSNDSLSVVAGTGLSGGGSIALGGSTTVSLAVPVENAGSPVGSFNGINYGDMLSATDNTDGTYTLDAFLNVADDGAEVGHATTLDFGASLDVDQNGDVFTIDSTASGGSTSNSLSEGQLGTLSTSVDSDEFEITGVAETETQGIGTVSVFPRSSVNDNYTFNSVDWRREWDEANNRLDVVVTVVWDEKPASNLDLDYVVWEGAGGTSSVDTTVSTTVSVSSSYASASWDEVVWGYTGSGNISVELPSPSDTGQFTVKKIEDANSLTITRPGTQQINGTASDLTITEGGVSRTFSSDGTNYEVI